MQLVGILMMFLVVIENNGKRLVVVALKEILIFKKITDFLKKKNITNLYFRKPTPFQRYFEKDKK